MNFQQLVIVSAVFVLAAAPSVASADELWNSNYGRVVYQSDRNKTAVWTYPAGTIFIEGLTGVTSNRGIYHRIWVGKSDVKCDTALLKRLWQVKQQLGTRFNSFYSA